MEVCAPVPSATIVITAATPMIMPSMVSAVRILFLPSALSATRKTISTDMEPPSGRYFGRRGQRRELLYGVAASRHRTIGDRQSVTECHDARAVLRNVELVRDQD